MSTSPHKEFSPEHRRLRRHSNNTLPNCCKRLTKRRLFARSPSGLLEQSTLGGRRGSRTAISIRRENRAAVSVAVFSRFAIYANVVSRTRQSGARRIGVSSLDSRDPFPVRPLVDRQTFALHNWRPPNLASATCAQYPHLLSSLHRAGTIRATRA